MSPFFSGFFICLSLIAAIGAQNAFVLKQALQRQYVLVVCLICALSDTILVIAGVAGFGLLVKTMPWIETVMSLAGAIFLTGYGIKSFWAAFTNKSALKPSRRHAKSLTKTIAICLAFTWLNPHVYLDTVVLLGSISTSYGDDRFIFALGAIAASFLFFFFLAMCGRYMAPLFAKPSSWRILEFVVGCIMFALSIKLILGIV